MSDMKFSGLEKNLLDITAEQQLKLGYRKEEIRLYYPKSSLLNLLDLEKLENDEIKREITAYFNDESNSSPLYGLAVSCRADRFCLTIPSDGSEYVHNRLSAQSIPEVEFLKEFLGCVSRHHLSLEDIKAVFAKYSDCVICRETDIPDFDYLIYFEDGIPDEYMYCIKFEGEHAIYHRFTKKDYMDFGF